MASDGKTHFSKRLQPLFLKQGIVGNDIEIGVLQNLRKAFGHL